jgi:hypothetical protein
MPDPSTVLQDRDGAFSSRRVLGFAAFGCLGLALLAEMLGHPIHDHLVDIFASIVGICVIGATADHLVKP